VTRIAAPPQTQTATVSLPLRFNLRDLGGTETAEGRAVAHGRLFRGASLHRLAPEELESLAPLGIRTAIDLRSTEEIGRGTFAGAGPVHHLPIFEKTPDLGDPDDDVAQVLADAYLWMLDEGPTSIRTALELLGDPDRLPVVVYCAAGKDRTGVLIAIVLRLLGVEPPTVAADYALSDAPAAALREWHLNNGASDDQLAAAGIFRAPTETMHLFLTALDDRFGSLDGYLETLGLDPAETRARLTASLLG
jgi:protein-tyrosine phosphatase